MIRRLLPLLAVGALWLSCCSSPPDNLCLSKDFTSEEREDFQTAIDNWRTLSKGRIHLQLSCELTGTNVWKVPSWDPAVEKEDSNLPGGGEVLATTDRHVGEMWIVYDRIPRYLFRPVVQHELGHWAQLRWPDCHDTNFVCNHVPKEQGPAIMTGMTSGATEFTPSDLAFCIESGACPADE